MGTSEAIWALGAMSGTSLDGVDAAMVRTDGHRIFEFGESRYQPFTDAQRNHLRAALGKTSGKEEALAAEIIETVHTELLAQFAGAELIGFHGQTTTHRPDLGETHQTGNGAVLAEALEIPVVWDFRTADMDMGGQGAPLAPFFHFALAKRIGATAPVAFLNIGGVSNLTWLDPRHALPDEQGACLAFDCGPGNAKMDDLLMSRRELRFDQDGALAASGVVDGDVLEGLLEREKYFSVMPPKSLDRDDFSSWVKAADNLSDTDALATLAAASAGAIARGLEHCPAPPERLLVSGGGRKNAELMRMIRALVPAPVDPVEVEGLDGDMIEAQAFAFLAVRVLRGLPTSAPGTTRVPAPVGGGRISRPGEVVALARG